MSARVSDSVMDNLLVSYQTILVGYLMTTDITTVLFIVVMKNAVMDFHNYVRCSLILEIVTVEYVNLINAGDGLII